MKLSEFNKQKDIFEYGMTSGESTPVSQQQTGASAQSRSTTQKPSASPSTAPSNAPSSAPSPSPSTQGTDQESEEPEAQIMQANQLEKDAVFPSEQGNSVRVISPANEFDPDLPDDAEDSVIVQDERTEKIYALDPQSKVAIPQVEESVFDRFDRLSLGEQLQVMAELNSDVINEAWSKKYKDSINCSNPKGFSQRAHCAGKKKKKKTSETIEAEQDMAALLSAYDSSSKNKNKKRRKKKTSEGTKPYFLKPGELRGSWKDADLRKLGFKLARNGSWYTSQANWQKLSKVGERHWRSLITESAQVDEAVPDNDTEYKLRQIMSQPLLTGDIRSQMEAYIAVPDPEMLLQFRLMRAEGGDNVDLRPVLKQYMQRLHSTTKKHLEI